MSRDSAPKTGLSRRKFFKVSGAVGAGSLAAAHSSGMALAARRSVERFPEEFREVIILGSGFGGSISALRLVERGIAVTIIEQGRRWDQPLKPGEKRFSGNLYPDGRSTWLSSHTVVPMGPPLPIRKTTGVLQGRYLAGKTVLNGTGFGGGSIAWGGVMVKPEERIFKMVFPKEVSFDELQPHYDEVARRLGRGTIPQDVEQSDNYKHVRVMKEHCDRADVTWEPIATSTNWDIVRDELSGKIPASVSKGEAIYGVNSGAKGGLDRTYLKEAEATGLLEVKTLHQVQSLGRNEQGHYVLEIHELDIDGNVIALRTFTCAKLFLSAGTITTNSLLVKAKAKGALPELNDEVGTGWGNNGNVYALRTGLHESTGSIQGGPPSVGINALDNPITPLFIEHPQLPVGIDIHSLLYFGIGITPTRGTFKYDAATDSVSIDWPKHDDGQAKVNEALLGILARLNEANGGWTTSLLTYLRSKVKDDICYHPLGGVVLGKASDFYGRVKGCAGLYVNDGSMLPGASGCCNPAMTIAAITERNIANILEHDFA